MEKEEDTYFTENAMENVNSLLSPSDACPLASSLPPTQKKMKYLTKKQKQMFENKILTNTDQEMLSACYVCKHKNVVQCIQVLSVVQRQVVSYHMCAKHTIPDYISQNLWGVQSFQKYVFYNFTASSTKRNGGGAPSLSNKRSPGSSFEITKTPKSKRGRKPKFLLFRH